MLEHGPLFDGFLALSQDAVVVADPHGRVAAWNGAAERLYGYAPDEALGRPIVVLLSAEALVPGERLAAVHAHKDRRSGEDELSAPRLQGGGAAVSGRGPGGRGRGGAPRRWCASGGGARSSRTPSGCSRPCSRRRPRRWARTPAPPSAGTTRRVAWSWSGGSGSAYQTSRSCVRARGCSAT